MIVESKGQFYNDRIQATTAYPRKRWSAIRNALHLTETRQVRSADDCQLLCNGFAQFFVDKIRSIKDVIKTRLGERSADDPLQSDGRHIGPMFNDILPPSVDEISKLIRSMSAKSSPMDRIPTSVIKRCADAFAPLLTRLVTLSFDEGKFPDIYKQALVTPLLKKESLDSDVLGNYRPISNLNTISKIVERVYMARLAMHVKRSPNYYNYSRWVALAANLIPNSVQDSGRNIQGADHTRVELFV